MAYFDKQSVRRFKITLLRWWAWFLVRWNLFWNAFLYGIGLCAPLWFINLMVYRKKLHKMKMEDDMGDFYELEFVNVVWNIAIGKLTIQRDITSRSLWYFQYVDPDHAYKPFMYYARWCLPWNDLHKRFFVRENDLEMNYWLWCFDGDSPTPKSDPALFELTLYQDSTYHLESEKYHWHGTSSDDCSECDEDLAVVVPGLDVNAEDDGTDSSSEEVKTQEIMYNQITFVRT